MGIVGEIFRVEDWRRAPVQVRVPFLTWVIVAVSTNMILVVIGWPTAPWRMLMALMAGTLAARLVRSVVGRWVGRR